MAPGRRWQDRERFHDGWEPDDLGWYPPSAPKLPPPEHGIKAKKFGTTWWGERWITALTHIGADYAARLGRGRTYAHQGRVHDLAVRDAVVSAHVTGSRATPYTVTLRLKRLPESAWTAAIKSMAAKARVAARLLAGEMPHEIDAAFGAVGASLFPARASDLAAGCTCPDWANPCKHVAAVHYVLGQAFDRDPFLLFELHGRSKARVLDELRRLRAGARPGRRRAAATGDLQAATVVLTSTAAAYEVARASVGDLRFAIVEPAVEGAVLRPLGSPPRWDVSIELPEIVSPVITGAARLARELALAPRSGDAETVTRATSEPSTP